MSDVSLVTNLIPTVNEGFITTVGGSGITSGGATVPLTSMSGLTNGTTFVGIVEPGQTNQQVFTGIVDTGGSQITGVKWTRGANVAHPAGKTVVDYVTGTDFNMLAKAMGIHADQDGTLKAGAVDVAAVLASNVVTTAKILDANVTTAKIADANVTTAKVADTNITNAKLKYGMIRYRQNGNSGDAAWNVNGSTNTDTSAKDTFIQAGTVVPAGLTTNITFPTAFTQVPLVFVTPAGSSGNFSAGWYIVLESTTGFSFVAADYTHVTGIRWMAIGQ